MQKMCWHVVTIACCVSAARHSRLLHRNTKPSIFAIVSRQRRSSLEPSFQCVRCLCKTWQPPLIELVLQRVLSGCFRGVASRQVHMFRTQIFGTQNFRQLQNFATDLAMQGPANDHGSPSGGRSASCITMHLIRDVRFRIDTSSCMSLVCALARSIEARRTTSPAGGSCA